MGKSNQFIYKWPLLGNESIVDFLQRSISNNKLAHFYIFSGAKNLGKSTLANLLASSLFCNNFSLGAGVLPCGECSSCRQFKNKVHSDVTIISKTEERKNISISQIRDFINRLNLGSFGGFYKIGIIKNADELSIEAANALLKILEEPKKGVIIILLASRAESLPATIISRSQPLFFKPVAADAIYDYLIKERGATREAAKRLSRLSAGRPLLAVKFLEDRNFLEEHKKISSAFLKVVNSSINEKFNLAHNLLPPPKSKSAETAKKADEILEIWQIMARDLLLSGFQLNELLVNYLMEKDIAGINLEPARLLKINQKIEKSREYLSANVNPGLVLEELSLSI